MTTRRTQHRLTMRIEQVPPSVPEASTRNVSLLRRKLSSTWARSPRRSRRTNQSVWRRLGSPARWRRQQCLTRRRLGQRRGRPVLNSGGNCARMRSCVWARGGIDAAKLGDFSRWKSSPKIPSRQGRLAREFANLFSSESVRTVNLLFFLFF
jgi:hypothetical protein